MVVSRRNILNLASTIWLVSLYVEFAVLWVLHLPLTAQKHAVRGVRLTCESKLLIGVNMNAKC